MRSRHNFIVSVLCILIYVGSRALTHFPELSEQAPIPDEPFHWFYFLYFEMGSQVTQTGLLIGYVYNSNTQEVEGSWIQDMPGLHGKTK